MNKKDLKENIEKNPFMDEGNESAIEVNKDAQKVTKSAEKVKESNNEEVKHTDSNNECDLVTDNEVEVSNAEEIVSDENDDKKPKKKKKILLLILPILLAGMGFASYKAIKFFNTEVPVNIEILDTNSPINDEIDKFIKDNKVTEGIHTIEYKNDTYALISSGTTKAKEASINIYQAYSKGFDIYLEYNLRINEKSIDDANPERVQMMLLKFNNAKDVKGILKTDDNESINAFKEPTGEVVKKVELKPE